MSDIPEHANITGISYPNTGDILSIDGGDIVITEENRTNYKINITVLMPLRLLDEPDYKKMLSFMKILGQLNEIKPHDEVVKLLMTDKIETISNMKNIEDNSVIVEILTAPTSIDGFDVTKLTNLQKMSINLYKNMSGIN